MSQSECSRSLSLLREPGDDYLINSRFAIVQQCNGTFCRRMFPGFAVSINGLKPKTKYTMRAEVVLADNHRFKFLNAR